MEETQPQIIALETEQSQRAVPVQQNLYTLVIDPEAIPSGLNKLTEKAREHLVSFFRS